MFEKELQQKFEKIFSVKKVSYDTPSDSAEQDCLFVEIDSPRMTFKDGRALAMVSGSAVMYGRSDELKFGFFAKAISRASNELTKDLFFSDLDSNTQRFRDIVQRGFSFTYFFNSQFDPDIGNITSVTTTVEET